ncbi:MULTISPECIES: hypothetical protein [unclassified Variovorax]|uniref:hypothetical protein n=1 Tax=unclassified Variovorax TaxID=663243 RepID=UPI003F47EF61
MKHRTSAKSATASCAVRNDAITKPPNSSGDLATSTLIGIEGRNSTALLMLACLYSQNAFVLPLILTATPVNRSDQRVNQRVV